MRQVPCGVLWLVVWLAGAGAWAGEAPGEESRMRAVPRSSPVKVDGQLDEAAWQEAPVYRSFRQSFPQPDSAPSQVTEVRILHDEDSVFFGIVAHDTQPELIDRRLGRRDTPPFSDMVTVYIDPRREGR